MMFKRSRNKNLEKGIEIEDSIMTITQKEEAVIEMPFKRRGLTIIWYVILLVILGLAARVFYLGFFRGQYYSEVSKYNRIRSIIIKAPRGMIHDRYGKVLARNVPSIDAVAVPRDLPSDIEERRSIARRSAEILGENSGNIELMMENLDGDSVTPVLLKENISQEQALILSERRSQLPGVAMEKTAIRQYEDGSVFSHIIGYDGKITREELEKNPDYMMTDYIGKNGLEKKYEREIRGQYGALQVEVDSLGDVKRTIGIINPISGSDLILNINKDLQMKFFERMNAALEETGTHTAVAVAVDPRDGGVLSLVNIPSYDNNLFARGITNEDYKRLVNDPDLPLFNRCVSGEYPPGSTIKPVIASGALSENVISPSTLINGLGGVLMVGSYRFGDWKVHGTSDVRTAIAESNDIFFYSIGGGYGEIGGLGMDRMKKYYDLFGFGRLTGLDLPGEAEGLIPDEQWKLDKIGERWYVGNSYHAAIGQGYIRVTPVQLANYTAALANGGTLYFPRIVDRIKMSNGAEKKVEPKVADKNFIRPDVIKVVREGMRQTVTGGTAQSLSTLPVEVAGKTGTAEFGTEKGNTHALFIAFAPYENPEIALAIIVPGAGEAHSSPAVRVAKEVLEWYFGEKSDK